MKRLLMPMLMLACSSPLETPPPPPPPFDAATADVAAGDAAPGDAGDLVTPVSTCAVPTLPDAGAISFVARVAYGPLDLLTDATRDSSQTLDVAWPAAPGPHPLVLLIHGGGWRTGNAQYYDDDARILASLGYVAASLNYRLVGAGAPNVFPAATSDVRCALRYLRAHAADYDIDATRVAAVGESAGGHLSAVLAVESEVGALDDGTCPAELATQSVRVSVAIGYYGPYDLTRSADFAPLASAQTSIAFVDGFLGGPMDSSPNAPLASPVAHVDPNDAPMLVLHGTTDPLIPANDAPELESGLRAAGVPATWMEVPDVGHGFPTISSAQPFVASTCTALAVLKTRLAP